MSPSQQIGIHYLLSSVLWVGCALKWKRNNDEIGLFLLPSYCTEEYVTLPLLDSTIIMQKDPFLCCLCLFTERRIHASPPYPYLYHSGFTEQAAWPWNVTCDTRPLSCTTQASGKTNTHAAVAVLTAFLKMWQFEVYILGFCSAPNQNMFVNSPSSFFFFFKFT